MTEAMDIEIFDSGDEPYLAWLHAHPAGFVLSLRRDRSGAGVVLHRAGCGTIRKYSQQVRRGAFTERDVIKVCSDAIEPLMAYAKTDGGRPDGSLGHRCRSCNPWSLRGGSHDARASWLK